MYVLDIISKDRSGSFSYIAKPFILPDLSIHTHAHTDNYNEKHNTEI